MKIVRPVIAFLLACFVVAVIWAFVAAIWGTNKATAQDGIGLLPVIFTLVASVSALPALALYVIASRRQNVNYKSAALGGFLIGAGLFLLFFSNWVSGSVLRGYAELIGMGGGLGLCGGIVFMFASDQMSRVVRTS